MKRILYIATSDINLKTGGGIANLAILNSLNKHYGNLVDVLHYEECMKGDKPSNFILVPPLSISNRVKSFIRGRIHRFTPWLDNFLKVNANKYSHCIINTGILGDCVEKIQAYGIKVATIHHNYEVEFQMDNKRPSTFYGINSYFVKKNEKASYLKSNLNLFLSRDDLDVFHEKYTSNITVPEYVIGIFEPNDRPIYHNYDTKLPENKLAICGSLNSVQTCSGIKHFKNNCISILDRIYQGNYILKIAGRNPGKSIYALAECRENIKVIPNPPIMSDVIEDCGIFICPTNVGGGIKLRILDGLQLGMPILTHEVSARGYNNLHCFDWFQIYNDSKSFQDGLYKIINEINHNHNLRQDILDAYNKYYSASNGDKIFQEAIDSFVHS